MHLESQGQVSREGVRLLHDHVFMLGLPEAGLYPGLLAGLGHNLHNVCQAAQGPLLQPLTGVGEVQGKTQEGAPQLALLQLHHGALHGWEAQTTPGSAQP